MAVTEKQYTHPITIFFLALPYGISFGFITVTLPFILEKNFFSVQSIAAISAIGISSNIWRFLWAPIIDIWLNKHTWHKVGVWLCSISLLSLVFIPLHVSYTKLIMLVVFISQIAATFVLAPIGGFMATVIKENKKGLASGFFQAGITSGLSGGLGILLATKLSFAIACIVVSLSMLSCIFTLKFVPKIKSNNQLNFKQGFNTILLGFKELLHSKLANYTTLLFLSPFASGAIGLIWSAIGKDWNANTKTVALVTGFLGSLVSILGSLFGGFLCDKIGRWNTYFGAGILLALVTILLAFLPFVPTNYSAGVLAYAFVTGIAYSAFSAAILKAIGNNLATTTYALISSLGNIPLVYMTALNGWLHDAYSVKIMLLGEGLMGLLFALIFLIVKKVWSIKG